MSDWTDELKAQVIQMYQEAEPTPQNSMEIVADIAKDLGKSPNGVRMILTKGGVYVKKEASSGSSSGSSGGGAKSGGSTRVSKEAAHAQLTKAIEDAGQSVDSEIISKLTGKAAIYLAGVIAGATSGGDE